MHPSSKSLFGVCESRWGMFCAPLALQVMQTKSCRFLLPQRVHVNMSRLINHILELAWDLLSKLHQIWNRGRRPKSMQVGRKSCSSQNQDTQSSLSVDSLSLLRRITTIIMSCFKLLNRLLHDLQRTIVMRKNDLTYLHGKLEPPNLALQVVQSYLCCSGTSTCDLKYHASHGDWFPTKPDPETYIQGLLCTSIHVIFPTQ